MHFQYFYYLEFLQDLELHLLPIMLEENFLLL